MNAMFSIILTNTVEAVSKIVFYNRQKPFVPGVWIQPPFEVDPMLIRMCAGDERAAYALVRMHLRDGRSVEWANKKAIFDLERDRS